VWFGTINKQWLANQIQLR